MIGTDAGILSSFAEQVLANKARLLAGTLPHGHGLLSLMSCHPSPDAETAVVVALQTNFAAWLGARELHAMSDRGR